MNPKQNYIITQRIQETHDVVILDLKPEQGEVFDFRPGQFVMVCQYGDDGQEWRTLPYSLCTGPTEKKYIELCVKICGEFTKRLAELKEGDTVGISGPFGRFTFNPKLVAWVNPSTMLKVDEKEARSAVFLAGGVGIAPFMSILRHATEKKLHNRIRLLYGNRTPHDIAYQNELQRLSAKNNNLSVVYTVDTPAPGWKGETGFISEEMLKKYCHPLEGKHFFLCGPPDFVDVMLELLPTCGVKKEFIKTEKF